MSRFHRSVVLPFLLAGCAATLLQAETITREAVRVDGGSLVMQAVDWSGQPTGTACRVTVGPVMMDACEVTWADWKTVQRWADSNGYVMTVGKGSDTNHPVQKVNWYDAVKWCNARSEMDGLTPVYYVTPEWTDGHLFKTGEVVLTSACVRWEASGWRLPTEAEWEWAARGGSQSCGYVYSGGQTPDEVAWYVVNSVNAAYDMVAGHGTCAVRTRQPNELGLYDMSGNVWEWCWDWRGDYPAGEVENPRGPDTGTYRVTRGGGWIAGAPHCRVDFRNGAAPMVRDCIFGFRAVRNAP